MRPVQKSKILHQASALRRGTNVRRIEEERVARCTVFRYGVLMEHGKACWQERIRTRGVDVARFGRLDGKPSRVVECAAIDAADIGEPLECDIKLCRASRTGMDVKTLATALGGVGVDRGGTTGNAHILWSKGRLNHIGRTR